MDFSSALSPLVSVIQAAIAFIYETLLSFGVESYGAAIVILTVAIKAALYPLTVKQIKSMKAMQELQPKMKKLQDQYKTNPQMLQQEMQRLYQEAGVNPLAGCLPLLAQMPILMAIYYALRDMQYAGNPSFLWIESLSEPDPYHVLPILSMISTFIVSSQTTPSDGNSQMKMMTYMMPAFIGWISWNFASGLVIYWIMMNAVQGLQQWWMYRGEKKPAKNAPEEKQGRKKK